MSNRYERIPSSHLDEGSSSRTELDEAFDDSDDELDLDQDRSNAETRPLNPSAGSAFRPQSPADTHAAAAYDFENYDFPPPGSPPLPSDRALPNDIGNTNGLIPSFSLDTTAAVQRRGWFRRTAASILPSYYVQKFGVTPRIPVTAIGGGTNNDGVFANVTAKPTRPIRTGEGDEAHLVPEDAQQEAPPSYASAQADAVPPYWETTIHAPFSSGALGDMIVDNLPTGSLFSFLWNMLVSISFQIVGFLLTYLLSTTHAARFGSRAGLGITLIQYGFALRGRASESGSDGDDADIFAGWAASPKPTFGTAAEADSYYKNATIPTPVDNSQDVNAFVEGATTQWLSFCLMTVGWFIFLSSVLGFWRVKRWERGIAESQRENASAVHASSSISAQFGLNAAILRHGLGLGAAHREAQEQRESAGADEQDPALDLPVMEMERRQRDVLRSNARLRDDLRAAGLI